MTTRTQASDRDAIEAHIRSIFDAYLAGDVAAIERTHTEDWRGFPVTARQLVRGRSGYMQQARQVLRTLNAVRYEFLDVDVEVLGDHALVYYLARDWLAGTHGPVTVLLRSLDVYRREAGGWNQCGSSISVLPETLAPPAHPRQPDDDVRQQVLAARDELWRAFFAGADALAPLLAPETLAFAAGGGAGIDRERILADARRFAADGSRLVRLEFPRTDWLCYGSVVVLLTAYEFEAAAANGARGVHRGRATELFAHRGGRWWNTAWHLEPGAEAPRAADAAGSGPASRSDGATSRSHRGRHC